MSDVKGKTGAVLRETAVLTGAVAIIAAVEAVFDWKAYLRENFPDTEIPEDRSDAAVSGPAQDQAISREEAR